MANPYTTVSVTNYNANPPPDDGSQTADNEITWSKHKAKIGDPLKTAIDAMNANVLAAFAKLFGNGVSAISTNYTVLEADQGKVFSVTNATTLTTPAANSVGSNFCFAAVNRGSSNIVIDGSGSETINGQSTITIAPGGAAILFSDGTNWTAIVTDHSVAPQGYLWGLTLSSAADADHDITVAVGEAAATGTVPFKMVLSASITKQADATFAEGTNQGGMVSGESLPTSGSINWWLISKADGTTDVCCNNHATSGFSPTLPTGFVNKRRILSLPTDSSANIRPFTHYGDRVDLVTPFNEVNLTTVPTSATLASISVPTGLNVRAILNIILGVGASGERVNVNSPQTTDAATSTSNAVIGCALANSYGVNQIEVVTNTSRQVRYRAEFGSGSVGFLIQTVGWYDMRGKDA